MQQIKDLGLTHKKDLTTLSTCGWYNYGIILPVTTVGDKGKLKVPRKFFYQSLILKRIKDQNLQVHPVLKQYRFVGEFSRLYIKFWVQFWDFEQQEKLKEL